MKAETALEDTEAGEARLELRAGDRRLAGIGMPGTGDRHTWTTIAAEFAAPRDGVHELSRTRAPDMTATALKTFARLHASA